MTIAGKLPRIALIGFVTLISLGVALAEPGNTINSVHAMKCQPDFCNVGGGGGGSAGPPVTYHGGGVMHNVQAYLIFWEPPGYCFDQVGSTCYDSRYEGLIRSFIGDLNGSSYFNLLNQYGDAQGPGGSSIQLGPGGGTIVDTTPYPSSTLSEGDIEGAVMRAVQNYALPTNNETAYLVFTPLNVHACTAVLFFSTGCDGTNWCGYHDWFTNGGLFGLGGQSVSFAYLPDEGSGCSTPSWPNSSIADNTINTLSHEIFEMVSDPRPGPYGGWFDWSNPTSPKEIGDKCAWKFGPSVDAYGSDLILNGHGYIVQQEWSNANYGCVL